VCLCTVEYTRTHHILVRPAGYIELLSDAMPLLCTSRSTLTTGIKVQDMTIWSAEKDSKGSWSTK
jgi:hypothetical protein